MPPGVIWPIIPPPPLLLPGPTTPPPFNIWTDCDEGTALPLFAKLFILLFEGILFAGCPPAEGLKRTAPPPLGDVGLLYKEISSEPGGKRTKLLV